MIICPPPTVPCSPLFHLTRVIMILVKSQTGSDHILTSYCPFSPTLPPNKSNNESGEGLDRKWSYAHLLLSPLTHSSTWQEQEPDRKWSLSPTPTVPSHPLFHLTRARARQEVIICPPPTVPSHPVFHLTRAITILVKSQTGSDHRLTFYCPFLPSLQHDKSNHDSVKEPDRKWSYAHLLLSLLTHSSAWQEQ